MQTPASPLCLRVPHALSALLIVLLLAGSGSSAFARADSGNRAAGDLPRVTLEGNYFARNGHRFVVVGTNWVSAKAGLLWPVEWDQRAIEADFSTMAKMGFNAVRLDLMWAWFEPRPGYYNPEAFAQFDALVKLAHKYHVYLNPILFTGGEVGEAWWDVPWRMGRDPQADPQMLYLETNLAEEFGRRYANEPAILAWDLADEPPFWISRQLTTDAMAANWTRLIAGAIRKHDKLHPIVVGTDTAGLNHGPFRPDVIADEVDYFSVHPYTIYTTSLFPDPMVSVRGTFGAAFATALNLGAGKPVMLQELGASSAQYSPAKITEFERTSYYSALGAGNNGFLPWVFSDAAPGQYHKVPYLRSPHETQFGLTTWDGQLKPRGAAFERFGRIVSRLDLAGVSPRGDVAIVVPQEWSIVRGDHSGFGLTGPSSIPYVSVTEGGAVGGVAPTPYEGNQWLMSALLSSYILARQAGWQPALPREQGDWTRYPLLLLPSPVTATDPIDVHVHTDFWAKAQAYVQGGGVLYASIGADAAIPEMTDLFGARMTDSQPVDALVLKFIQPFGSFKPGDTLHFAVPGNEMKYWGTGLEVTSGQVVAVDQQGRPALVTHTVGKGKTVLSAYPLEAYLGNTPQAFEGAGDEAQRLYAAIRDWSGVEPRVRTDQPDVEASALEANGRGYVVLVNHSATARHARLITPQPLGALRQLDAKGGAPVACTRDACGVDVPAWDGVVLEWGR